jgi:hypothetical protein
MNELDNLKAQVERLTEQVNELQTRLSQLEFDKHGPARPFEPGKVGKHGIYGDLDRLFNRQKINPHPADSGENQI